MMTRTTRLASRRRVGAGVLGIALFALAGCGGPTAVEGKVKMSSTDVFKRNKASGKVPPQKPRD